MWVCHLEIPKVGTAVHWLPCMHKLGRGHGKISQGNSICMQNAPTGCIYIYI